MNEQKISLETLQQLRNFSRGPGSDLRSQFRRFMLESPIGVEVDEGGLSVGVAIVDVGHGFSFRCQPSLPTTHSNAPHSASWSRRWR